MAYEFYVTIKGTKQGQFKGESANPHHKDQIPGIGFFYEIEAPRDPATGQASGKRQHSPVTLTKEWGAASPQIFQALVTNEVLEYVLFEFMRTKPTGEQYVYYTIRLSHAAVSELKQYVEETEPGPSVSARDLEDVSFTFQKIQVEDKDAKTSATDDWTH